MGGCSGRRCSDAALGGATGGDGQAVCGGGHAAVGFLKHLHGPGKRVGVVFLTQHDFRASAWRLFATGGLLPASAKLFRLDRVRELGLSFVSSGSFDHLFVLDYLSDVERVGIMFMEAARRAPLNDGYAMDLVLLNVDGAWKIDEESWEADLDYLFDVE